MKKLIILLLVLAVSVWAALKIKADPGYFALGYQDTLIEMPLWLAVLLAVVLFLLFTGLSRIIKQIYFIPEHIVDWYTEKNLARIRRRTARGFIALAEGRWKVAEQLLSKNIDKRHTALLNCLGAAIAAQRQGKEADRDEYLRLAHTYHSHAQIAIGLTQARLQYAQGQLEQSLASLRRLLLLAPKHATLLLMLKAVLIDLKAWSELLDLLKILQKQKLITEEEAFTLTQQSYVALLAKAKNANNEAINPLWDELPHHWQLDSALLLQYVPYLLAYGRHEQAEHLLRQGLNAHWDPQLVRYYGLTLADEDKQIKTAHAWLKHHPDDAMLLLTLGRLLYRQELWGQAKEALQKSLAVEKYSPTYLLLAQLCMRMQLPEQSRQYYQEGLQLACQDQMR